MGVNPDIFLSALEAGTSLISPEAGAFVAAVTKLLSSSHDRANQRAVDRLRSRLRDLEDRLDSQQFERDEVAEIAKQTFVLLDQVQYEEKANAALEIFLNAGLKEGDADKRPYDELDHFCRSLRTLSIGALRVLGIAVSLGVPGHKSIDSDAIAAKYGALEPDLCVGLLRELESCHFIFLEITNMTYNGRRSAQFGITDLGLRFHQHILKKAMEKSGEEP